MGDTGSVSTTQRSSGAERLGAALGKGAGGSLAITIAGIGLGYVVQVVLARLLGVDQYGDYMYVTTWVNTLLLLVTTGWNIVLPRFLPVYIADQSWSAGRGLLRRSRQLTFLVAGVCGVLTALGVWLLGERLSFSLRNTFWLASAFLPLLALLRLTTEVFRALKFATLAAIPDVIIRPLVMTALVATFCFLTGNKASAPDVMIAMALGTAVGYGLALSWLSPRLPLPIRREKPEYETRAWLTVTLPMLSAGIVNSLLSGTDVIILGALHGTKEAGIYAAAAQLSRVLVLGATAMQAGVLPIISVLHAQGRQKELRRLFYIAVVGMLAFGLVGTVFMSLFGGWLLGMYDPSFSSAYGPLVLLTVGQVLYILGMVPVYFLLMAGRTVHYAWLVSATSVLAAALNAAFIPFWGSLGAAVASVSSMFLFAACCYYFVREILEVPNPGVADTSSG
jgi:O-antigen/teichoic acid export membrane protein